MSIHGEYTAKVPDCQGAVSWGSFLGKHHLKKRPAIPQQCFIDDASFGARPLAKCNRIRLVDRFFLCRTVSECAGNLRNFGDPAAVVFEFSLYDESQVLAPGALRRFSFGTHIS